MDPYSITKKDKYTTIKVHESKFTAKIAPDLKTELVLLNSIDVKNIIFDLGEVTYCDSSGLSVVLVAHRVCNEHNGVLVLCGVNDSVMKLIDISQLTSILNITPTHEEAVDFVFMDELEKGLSDSGENLN